MNTPSSKDYFILTGYQVFSKVVEAFEATDYGFTCCRISDIVRDILCANSKFDRHSAEMFAISKVYTDKLIDILYEYFCPEATHHQSVVWPSSLLMERIEPIDCRIVASTILADICKQKQIKFYIDRTKLDPAHVKAPVQKVITGHQLMTRAVEISVDSLAKDDYHNHYLCNALKIAFDEAFEDNGVKWVGHFNNLPQYVQLRALIFDFFTENKPVWAFVWEWDEYDARFIGGILLAQICKEQKIQFALSEFTS